MHLRWVRRVLATVVALVVAAPPGPLAAGAAEERAAVGAQLVVGCGDCWPIAFAFARGGKELYYLERYSGEIHRYRFKGGVDTVWGRVGPVDAAGERGALGLALDPRWNKGKKKRRWRNRWVYVFYTHAQPVENRIVRLRKRRRSRKVQTEHLFTIPINTSATNHNGGVIHVGPDRKLYAVTGDQATPSRSQSLADPAGKILRLNLNGSRPADNPIGGSAAYSYGHRNSFGFAFDPATGRLWQGENGPACDELNLVVPGRNHGWGPGSSGACPTSTSGPSPVPPEREWEPAIVPTGVAFCSACGLGPDVEGDLLIGTFGGGTQIRNLSLDGERDDMVAEGVLYDHGEGILAVERRGNGQVWFSDNGGIYRLTP